MADFIFGVVFGALGVLLLAHWFLLRCRHELIEMRDESRVRSRELAELLRDMAGAGLIPLHKLRVAEELERGVGHG
jgi:hypothetical protein